MTYIEINKTYYIYTHKIKINRQDKSEDEIIELIISEYASILEEKIKQHPEQYFWFHKKWSKLIYKNG